MATLCRRYGLLFIMTPFTACSAVAKALREQLGGEWLPAESVKDSSGNTVVCRKHATLKHLLKGGVLTRRETDALFKFATVRNPFDYAVSAYVKRAVRLQRAIRNPKTRQARSPRLRREIEFCRDHSLDQWIQWRYVESDEAGRPGEVKQRRHLLRQVQGVDFIMRYENLADDFALVLQRAGIEDTFRVPVFHQTTGKRPDYRTYYSEASRAIVERAYADVLESFSYAF